MSQRVGDIDESDRFNSRRSATVQSVMNKIGSEPILIKGDFSEG